VVAVNAPVEAELLRALSPLHPPEAVQDVALVDDQESVEAAPLARLLGAAPSVTVGAGVAVVTVTVAVALALPPAPVQPSV
jgi:hypothetical protein